MEECNIILAMAYEYRPVPSKSMPSIVEGALPTLQEEETKEAVTSRFMGLIVVPGHHITKIELQHR